MSDIPANVLTVARALRDIGIVDLTYVGGAVVPLLLTDPAAPRPRVTLDVDVVIDVAPRHRFNEIEDNLRAAGHTQPPDGPICRWLVHGILVDFMPVEAEVLGFSNPWYRYLEHSYDIVDIGGGQSLRVASPAVWLATKLQAFLDRGKDDLISSQDLEDVVILVDGRPELSKEIEGADADVRAFIVSVFRSLLVEEELRVAVQAHLPPDDASRARAAVILSRIEEIAELS